MAENALKVSQSVSPASRAGAGDFTRRPYATPTSTRQNRTQPMHPKKLYSTPTPVSKFTGRRAAPSPNLARIRSCLDEYRPRAPASAKIRSKASSMEDLTPSKKTKKESGNAKALAVTRSPRTMGLSETQAAARVSRFMLVVSWRRRKDEIVKLRRSLESKRSCNERLRIQVWVLRSLLDSDNAKVVLAMRELERLKQLLKDKEAEKAVLEQEKLALEKDVSASEDRASQQNIAWRNARNELDATRGLLERCERERAAERAAVVEARSQRDHAYTRLSLLEEELTQHEALLSGAEAELAEMRQEADQRNQMLQCAAEHLRSEQEARARNALEGAAAAREAAALRARLRIVEEQLGRAVEQLAWWPRPLTKMMGLARSLLRHPMSFSEALVWSLLPSRHGC